MGMNRNTPFENEHVVIDAQTADVVPGSRTDDPFADSAPSRIGQKPETMNNILPMTKG